MFIRESIRKWLTWRLSENWSRYFDPLLITTFPSRAKKRNKSIKHDSIMSAQKFPFFRNCIFYNLSQCKMRTSTFCQNCGRSDLPPSKWNTRILQKWESELVITKLIIIPKQGQFGQKELPVRRTGWPGRPILTRPKSLMKKLLVCSEIVSQCKTNLYCSITFIAQGHLQLTAICMRLAKKSLIFFLFSLLWINAV